MVRIHSFTSTCVESVQIVYYLKIVEDQVVKCYPEAINEKLLDSKFTSFSLLLLFSTKGLKGGLFCR